MRQHDVLIGIARGLATVCASTLLLGAWPTAAAAQGACWSTPSADTLVQLGREDQQGRAAIAQAVVNNDTAVVRRSMVADSGRSRWLRRVVSICGWPTRTGIGQEAASAAWLILQHSPFNDWQNEMLPALEQLVERGELPRPDFALLTDRVLVRRGEPQRYGSHFDVIDGRLVPARIANVEELEQRRNAMGLPPMSEYTRMLAEVYKLPVVWPPPR